MGTLELARFVAVVIVDLDGGRHQQHIVSCDVTKGLVSPSDGAEGTGCRVQPPLSPSDGAEAAVERSPTDRLLSAARAISWQGTGHRVQGPTDRLLSAAHAISWQQEHAALPAKLGYLRKRGDWWWPGWHRRWVVLHHGTLEREQPGPNWGRRAAGKGAAWPQPSARPCPQPSLLTCTPVPICPSLPVTTRRSIRLSLIRYAAPLEGEAGAWVELRRDHASDERGGGSCMHQLLPN